MPDSKIYRDTFLHNKKTQRKRGENVTREPAFLQLVQSFQPQPLRTSTSRLQNQHKYSIVKLLLPIQQNIANTCIKALGENRKDLRENQFPIAYIGKNGLKPHAGENHQDPRKSKAIYDR